MHLKCAGTAFRSDLARENGHQLGVRFERTATEQWRPAVFSSWRSTCLGSEGGASPLETGGQCRQNLLSSSKEAQFLWGISHGGLFGPTRSPSQFTGSLTGWAWRTPRGICLQTHSHPRQTRAVCPGVVVTASDLLPESCLLQAQSLAFSGHLTWAVPLYLFINYTCMWPMLQARPCTKKHCAKHLSSSNKH